MPRADNIPKDSVLLKALILGDPKSGKTDWAMRAADAGFNVLYFDGDVATQTISQLTPEGKKNLYLMDVGDRLMGEGVFDPRMIQIVADFLTSSKFLWNDSKGQKYSPTKDEHSDDGVAVDEIWEFYPAKLDSNWVIVLDSWTTLAYSAMLAKAGDMGVDLSDIEKVERSIYSGVGNRLTSVLSVIQKAPCHVVAIGHPKVMEKTKSPEGKSAREAKEIDRVVEWTKMIPSSSSNPHGLSMGKYFSDIGWMEINAANRRKLNFKINHERVAGGHLDSIGDPRESHSFAELIKFLGGSVPEGTQGLGEGLIIHPANSFIRPSKGKTLAASTPAKPMGLAKLGGLPTIKS